MLILTRCVGEGVVIDGNVKVYILKVKGNQVRVGIDAPPSIPVDREEIHERKMQELVKS